MPWIQIGFDIPRERFGLAEAVLEGAGALSVTCHDSADEPVLEPAPGEQPLWSRVSVSGLFADEIAVDQVKHQVRDALGGEPPAWWTAPLADRVWERVWMDDYHPMRFGEHLWVVPTHCEIEEIDAVALRLDPGLAFGTGTHPTTALCLEYLDAHPPSGERVLDYGCGSGILAVAALMLGGVAVEAIDNDPQALIATAANAQFNRVAGRLCVHGIETPSCAPADLVIANILSGVLIELAPRLVASCRAGGRLVLSGLLDTQADAVAAAFRPWVELTVSEPRDGWVRLSGRRE